MYIETERIYEEAARENLEIVFDDTGRLYGCIIEHTIILNSLLRSDETLLRCVLSEEIGHRKRSPANWYSIDPSYIGRILDHKTEALALEWAINFLIPDQQEFIYLYSMYDSPQTAQYNLSEYYKVTPQFIKLKERMIMI